MLEQSLSLLVPVKSSNKRVFQTLGNTSDKNHIWMWYKVSTCTTLQLQGSWLFSILCFCTCSLYVLWCLGMRWDTEYDTACTPGVFRISSGSSTKPWNIIIKLAQKTSNGILPCKSGPITILPWGQCKASSITKREVTLVCFGNKIEAFFFF